MAGPARAIVGSQAQGDPARPLGAMAGEQASASGLAARGTCWSGQWELWNGQYWYHSETDVGVWKCGTRRYYDRRWFAKARAAQEAAAAVPAAAAQPGQAGQSSAAATGAPADSLPKAEESGQSSQSARESLEPPEQAPDEAAAAGHMAGTGSNDENLTLQGLTKRARTACCGPRRRPEEVHAPPPPETQQPPPESQV